MMKFAEYCKIILLVVLISYTHQSTAQGVDIPERISSKHPRILTTTDGQASLNAKLIRAPWAATIVENLKKGLAPYLQLVQKDSTWMYSRLQMYWNSHYTNIYIKGNNFIKGDGRAAFPTVRFAGTRDWATDYSQPALKDVIPFADPADGKVYVFKNGQGVWVEPSATGAIIEQINRKILDFAQNAAFLYWLTGDEIYAKFAEPIFKTYVTGLYYRNFPTSLDEEENKISGLTSFETIHQPEIVSTVLCYDFLYNYLQKKDSNYHDSIVATVFKKWADNLLNHGVKDNNWNIFEAHFLTYLALALENNEAYKDGKGAEYYLNAIFNKSNPGQAPLSESIKRFDKSTYIWDEAPGYAANVSKDFLKVMLLSNKFMPNTLDSLVNTLGNAVLATTQYLMPNDYAVSFGDSHYRKLPSESMEMLISWYHQKGNQEKEKIFTELLKFSQDEENPRKNLNSLFELFFYTDQLMNTENVALQDFASPTFYTANISWFAQRNGFGKDDGLMISTNASLGNHAHANGISMELYGKGYPLAPDFAAGDSYWQQNHKEFYSQFAAHNTVVVNGKSAYGSMRGHQPFQLKSYYPPLQQSTDIFKNITYGSFYFKEPSTKANQLRMLGTVRINDTTGYYVDIFRSAIGNGNDNKNEYLYHNIGQNVVLTDLNDQPLKLESTNELSEKNGDIVGYNYFTDKKSASISQGFKARFDLNLPSGQVNMNMWMPAQKNRTLFSVLSPKARSLEKPLLPSQITNAPVPTLVLRQQGEAWNNPFMAIFEPSENQNSQILSVESIKSLNENQNFAGLVVKNKDQSTQYIFSDSDSLQTNKFNNFSFKGTYAVVSEKKRQLNYLFLGHGKSLSNGKFTLLAKDSNLTATLEHISNHEWQYFAEQASQLKILSKGFKKQRIIKAIDQNGNQLLFKASRDKADGERFFLFNLPALKNNHLIFKLK